MKAFHNDLTKIDTLRQVIESCPSLNRIVWNGGQLTGENWTPIIRALSQVPHPEVTLALEGGCTLDEDANTLLHDFLHESPTSVNLRVDVGSTEFPTSESSWLPYLLGPSVRSMTFHYFPEGEVASNAVHEIKDVMSCLNQTKTQNIQMLAFDNLGDDAYQVVLDGIPSLFFVNTIWFSPSMFAPFAPLKKKLLDSLAQNASIQKVTIVFFSRGGKLEGWTDKDDQRLKYLQQRNVSIWHIMATPNLIPLSAWPYVFQSVQKLHARSFLVFQGLRGLADCLPGTLLDGSERRASGSSDQKREPLTATTKKVKLR